MSSKDYLKEYRANRKANRICMTCGNPLAETDKTIDCAGCKETKGAERKERQEKRKTNGLCPVCGQSKTENSLYCQKHLDKDKDRYDKAKAQGLCTTCRKNPVLNGSVRCVSCKENFDSQQSFKRGTRESNNICIQCGQKPSLENIKYCIECSDKDRLRNKNKTEKRKELGLCHKCGVAPRVEGKSRCATCSSEDGTNIKNLRSIRKSEGLCNCGRIPLEGFNQCAKCKTDWYEDQRIYKEKRRTAGVCIGCGKNPPKEDLYNCQECLDKNTWGKIKRVFDLTKEQWQDKYRSQEGRCPITGFELFIPGTNMGKGEIACVDHDHATGQVRELLHPLANRLIGLMGEDVEFIRIFCENAIRYLEKWKK